MCCNQRDKSVAITQRVNAVNGPVVSIFILHVNVRNINDLLSHPLNGTKKKKTYFSNVKSLRHSTVVQVQLRFCTFLKASVGKRSFAVTSKKLLLFSERVSE